MAVRLIRTVAGLAVAVLGLALALVGAQERPPEVHPGRTSFLLVDRPGIEAHNTPSVASHPARPHVLAAANRIDTPFFGCSLALSENGGGSWRPVELPLAAPNCYWIDVAYAGDGSLLVLYTATGGLYNLPVSVWVQRFEGTTPAGPPVQVAGSMAFHADLVVSEGRVLVTWVQAGPATVDKPVGFAPPRALVVTRSLDGGRTFSPPVTLSEPERLVALPTVLAGKGDQVVVGALDLGDDLLDYEARHESQGGPPAEGRWRVVSWTSEDGGATFGPTATVSDDLVIPQRLIVNLGPAPGFARDPTGGRLYATWDAGRGDDRDVFLASSDDGGRTWTPARRVVRRPGTQSLPAVAVAPDGRVDVLFYDRSRDPEDRRAETVLASSWDGGGSFTAATVSDRGFDTAVGFGSAQGIPLQGSHLAVLSEPGRALAFWADTRKGTVDTNRQDVALTSVGVRPAQGPRWPLVVLGAVLFVAGNMALVAGLRPKLRPSRSPPAPPSSDGARPSPAPAPPASPSRRAPGR